jgi:hypothetical protein
MRCVAASVDHRDTEEEISTKVDFIGYPASRAPWACRAAKKLRAYTKP